MGRFDEATGGASSVFVTVTLGNVTRNSLRNLGGILRFLIRRTCPRVCSRHRYTASVLANGLGRVGPHPPESLSEQFSGGARSSASHTLPGHDAAGPRTAVLAAGRGGCRTCSQVQGPVVTWEGCEGCRGPLSALDTGQRTSLRAPEGDVRSNR